jgi:tetratricopeptide (TPR) repeat protein
MEMMKFFSFLLFLLFSLSLAFSTEEEVVNSFIKKYEYGQYEAAIEGFRSLLYPLVLKKMKNITTAHLYLGFCYCLTEQKQEAKKEFLKVLKLSPQLELNPDFVPPVIIQIFNQTRAEFEEEKKKKQKKISPPKIPKNSEKKELLREKKDLIFSKFYPFGWEQFRQGKRVKGYILGGGQVLSLATTLFAYFRLEKEKDTIPGVYWNYDEAEKWQQVQKISFATFCLFYLTSVGENFWFKEKKPRKTNDK